MTFVDKVAVVAAAGRTAEAKNKVGGRLLEKKNLPLTTMLM